MLDALLNIQFKDLSLDIQLLTYFTVLFLGVIITMAVSKFLNNKSKVFISRTIFIILIIGLVTHFMKPFFYPYTEMEYPLVKLTFENICAVSILTFPLIFKSKSELLKDYMVIFGIISGVISFILPVVILDHSVLSFEFARFYIVHFVIFLAPYLMARHNVHQISIYRVIKIPLVLMGVLFIIFINELVVTALGWVPVEELFDPSKRNPSIIFGLGELPELLPKEIKPLTVILTGITPNFMMNTWLLPKGAYWPVIWMIGPAFVYGISLSVLVLYYFDKEEVKGYFKKIFNKESASIKDRYE